MPAKEKKKSEASTTLCIIFMIVFASSLIQKAFLEFSYFSLAMTTFIPKATPRVLSLLNTFNANTLLTNLLAL